MTNPMTKAELDELESALEQNHLDALVCDGHFDADDLRSLIALGRLGLGREEGASPLDNLTAPPGGPFATHEDLDGKVIVTFPMGQYTRREIATFRDDVIAWIEGARGIPLVLPEDISVRIIGEKVGNTNAERPIEDFDLSVRIRVAIRNFSIPIQTLGDLSRMTSQDLMSCRNFGKESLKEVKDTLHKHGMALADEQVHQGQAQ